MTLPLWIVMFYFFGLYDRRFTHPLQVGRLLFSVNNWNYDYDFRDVLTNTPLFPAKLAGYATGIGFVLLMIFRSATNIVRLKSY